MPVGSVRVTKRKVGFILVGRVEHWHYCHGPWRISQHNLTGLVAVFKTHTGTRISSAVVRQRQQEQ